MINESDERLEIRDAVPAVQSVSGRVRSEQLPELRVEAVTILEKRLKPGPGVAEASLRA
jgi:hypothetical protein